jgi:hypothetical protein
MNFSKYNKDTGYRTSKCGHWTIQTIRTFARVTRTWYVLRHDNVEVGTFDKLDWARARADKPNPKDFL